MAPHFPKALPKAGVGRGEGAVRGEPGGFLPRWTALDPLEPSVEAAGARAEGRGVWTTRGEACVLAHSQGTRSPWAGDTRTLTGSSAHRSSQTSSPLQEQTRISERPPAPGGNGDLTSAFLLAPRCPGQASDRTNGTWGPASPPPGPPVVDRMFAIRRAEPGEGGCCRQQSSPPTPVFPEHSPAPTKPKPTVNQTPPPSSWVAQGLLPAL